MLGCDRRQPVASTLRAGLQFNSLLQFCRVSGLKPAARKCTRTGTRMRDAARWGCKKCMPFVEARLNDRGLSVRAEGQSGQSRCPLRGHSLIDATAKLRCKTFAERRAELRSQQSQQFPHELELASASRKSQPC
jgi:hypothetical protein